MKVAMVLYKYFPFGGLQSDFRHFFDELVARGHEVCIYCISFQSDGEINIQQEGVELKLLEAKALSNHKRNEKFIKLLKQDLLNNPVDVVFGFNKMPSLDVYYAADSCYADKAETQRGWLYRASGRFKHFYKNEQAVFSKNNKTKILLISDTEKRKFEHYYHTEDDRMFMLPPGISKTKLRPDNVELIKEQFKKEFSAIDKRILLFVGSGFIKKGLDRAILALASLPEDKKLQTLLFVVGQDKKQRFVELAKKHHVEDQVKFFSGRNDVERFLWSADYLIHPAYDEAAGIVLLEALVAGLPVIVTDVCGYAFHIAKAKAGVVLTSPFSQDKLNELLLKVLSTDNSEWSRNALKYAQHEDLYRMHKAGADIVEAVYEEKVSVQ